MMSFRGKPLAKALAFIPLCCWLILLPGCHLQDRPDSAGAAVTVVEVSRSVYTPAETARATPAEAEVCKAWSLDAAAATEFFALSKRLGEGELHGYDWLPCSIKGRVQAEGKIWDFEINAAGTSTWRSAGETRLLGCAQAACEPFVILMPQGLGD